MRNKKGRSKKSEASGNPSTRQRILDAAFKAFLKAGYDRTSTLEIATLAKVSKRELYTYFEDKAALFAAGIRGRTDRMRVPLVAPDISNPNALARTLEAYGASLLTGATHAHVLAVHRLVIAESQHSPELATILDREGRQANVGALVELMSQAQARGLLATGDPQHFASLFSSLLWGDLFSRLLMRVEKTPSAGEIARRSREATRAFLELHAASGRRR
ncbi:MAG: TetR/AcrR family transcriptional regulator [Proteobacteria bacterium]|nr:TetR/AcrR family transcriptional regulator [Pseudomonadota bacterium]